MDDADRSGDLVRPHPAPDARVSEVLTQLEALEDPKVRAINERHGDDHGVNLTKLRALAKSLPKDPALARDLWATGTGAARLVAILLSKPAAYPAEELDAMLRAARTPKVSDWLVGYVVGKSSHREALRTRWLADPDPNVAGAGWSLTADRVVKDAHGLALAELLDQIEASLVNAPTRLQWAMNLCLGQIGIEHPDLRPRVLAIGERLGVLKDYPTAPGCTSPYVPIWVTEIVRRRSGTGGEESHPEA